jgi:hypothetical protein
VLTEYFAYLRRDPDQPGYDFWLSVLKSDTARNYRGMVCSFVTSAEYQQRFAVVVTRSNSECALAVQSSQAHFQPLRGLSSPDYFRHTSQRRQSK